MTLFAQFARRGGSLAALAVALAVTAPAAPAFAQEMTTMQADDPAPPPPQRPSRVERSGGPARAEVYRPEPAPPPRYERPAPERPAPRFERAAEPRPAPERPVFTPQAPPMRVDPDVEARAALGQRADDRRGERRGRGGFGGDVINRAEAAQRDQVEPRRPDPRADRPERRSEPPVAQGGWQGGRRDGGQAGAPQGGPGGWQGERRDGTRGVPPVGAPGTWQGERRDGTRGDRVEGRRDDRVEGRVDGRVDGRRDGRVEQRRDDSWGGGIRDLDRQTRSGEWRGDRDGRRDDWRDGRRDDRRADRRDWRRDDWRWGWNGRPGWDNRDFRRWDNRWRDSRSYNWSSYRRSHRVIYQPGPYFAPYRSHRYDRLSIGFYLDSLFFQPRFFINDPWAYRLPPAYGPYQWVRYYDDVLLVDIYSGEVVDVIYDFFW